MENKKLILNDLKDVSEKLNNILENFKKEDDSIDPYTLNQLNYFFDKVSVPYQFIERRLDLLNKELKEGLKMKLFFYNGMSKPKEININDIVLDHNYLGNITAEFIEEYNSIKSSMSIEDIEENQPFYNYNIWVNPTRDMLQDYNKSKGLDKDQYLI